MAQNEITVASIESGKEKFFGSRSAFILHEILVGKKEISEQVWDLFAEDKEMEQTLFDLYPMIKIAPHSQERIFRGWSAKKFNAENTLFRLATTILSKKPGQIKFLLQHAPTEKLQTRILEHFNKFHCRNR